MKILVINGPNINLLGLREPDIYGKEDYSSLCRRVQEKCEKEGIEVKLFQSNHEGDLIDTLQSARGRADGVILNAGALSHYSYALADAITACGLPCVEVHLSNIFARESFRHESVIAPFCIGTISGFGSFGYHLALAALVEKIKSGAGS